jgi:proteasome accessory factor B
MLYQKLHQPGGWVSPRDDCRDFGCDKRTLQRDMTVLRATLGEALRHHEVPGHGWVYSLHAPAQPWQATSAQVLAILAGAKATQMLSGEHFNCQVKPLLETLVRATDFGTQRRLRTVDQLVHVTRSGHKPYRDQPTAQAHLGELVEALMRTLPVDLGYLSPRRAGQGKAPLQIRCWPLSMVLHRGGAYFVIQALEGPLPAGKRVLLALDRITDARRPAGAQVFEYPSDFNVEAFFEEAFGVHTSDALQDVVVRIAPTLASYALERTWHPSQSHTVLPDGSVELTLRVRGDQDVLNWVAGLGEHAELVRPAALRERMRVRLQASLGHYGG